MKAFLPDQSRISQVHLRTANLKRALGFYTGVLRLNLLHESGSEAALAAADGQALLLLTEERNAPPRPPRTTGLYHFALRYPSRGDLACAYRRLLANNYPVTGASDHEVSEAIYLNDPDGNGVELYADRPRSQWPQHNGEMAMGTRALDLNDLLATESPAPAADERPQFEIGHIHLNVPDLTQAERFYGDFLGLAVTQRSYSGALFLSAGGYHHHIGANTWAGKSAPLPNSVGLISYRFEVPVTEILYCLGHRAPLVGYETRTRSQPTADQILQVRDPSGFWLEVSCSPTDAAAPASGCRVGALVRRLIPAQTH